MIPNRFEDPSRQAREAALDAVATIVAEHLRDEDAEPKLRDDSTLPLLVHVHGPGKSTFVETLARRLDFGARSGDPGSWTAIRFDAWQHQRVAPPWWWLINTLDRELRTRFREHSWPRWFRKRAADLVTFRLWRFLRDAVWIVPGILAVIVAVWLWDMSTILKIVGALAGVAGGVAALLALVASFGNAVRRHLLSQSPRGAAAVLSRTDPMADLLLRYGFLVNTAGTPVLMLIDNLDRCRADYVVETLEGMQTLLRIPPGQCGHRPLVAFVVAADEAWLCDSYLQVYGQFAKSANASGRPFGQSFLDKIFDVSLRVPRVPSSATLSTDLHKQTTFAECPTEQAVRQLLGLLEGERAPIFDLRVEAVRHLGELEVGTRLRHCGDTGVILQRLRIAADQGPIIDKRLDTSYCVQRTSLLLGGYAVDHDEAAIARLGLWTMLSLRWPLLAAHLAREPEDLDALHAGEPPDGIDDDLAPVFQHAAAVRLARDVDGVRLQPNDIRRLTTPLARQETGAAISAAA